MMTKKTNSNTRGKISQTTTTQEKKSESYSGLQLESKKVQLEKKNG